MSDNVEVPGVRAEVPVGAEDAQQRLESMFRDHASRLYHLALRMSGTDADAEDTVQEVFVRAARSVRSVPLESDRARAWLVRTLVNVERDKRRRSRVRRIAGAELSRIDRTVASSHSAPLAGYAVREALATLSPRRRAILVLSAIEGRTVPEIAVLLGVSQVTVRWHLMQARRSLRPLLGVADHA